MKKLLTFLSLSTFALASYCQIVVMEPTEAVGTDEVKIIYDASQGTGNLVGASKVYIHTGVIISGPTGESWQNVVGNWGQDDGVGEMTKVAGETDKWEFTITPSINEYYSVSSGQTVFRLGMVFRNADGSAEGKGTPGSFEGGSVGSNGDIYIDLAVNQFVTIQSPITDQFVVAGASFPISVQASDAADQLEVFVDEGAGFELLESISNSATLVASYTASADVSLKIKAVATFGSTQEEDINEIEVKLRGQTVAAPLPVGTIDGINYIDGDDTKVVLSLLAPDKDFVYVVGDFNDWEIDDDYLMQVDANDSSRFFIEINGLESGKPYVYQYWVEGVIKVGDPFADQVADPWNDEFIPTSVYPNLPTYDKTDYGVATVLQTGQQDFEWPASEDNWTKHDQEKLVVYELLVRDFVGSHDYKDVIDSLSYLKRLGINAIELMPIMEFEGNSSWGYNPSYYFAPDKYYGTKNDLKNLIAACHAEGMAVILDMVLNHSFGQSPLVMMYFDSENGKPSTDNPWFNPDATHPFNVGYDFNHESPYTKDYVDKVNKYWIEEYHFDGYRFDLSKGFTQTNNPDDIGAWGQLDQSRIDILTRMADKIWETDPTAYVILEHFADEDEETILKNEGMMVWGNSNHDFRQLLAGNGSPSGDDIKEASRVSYIESHDEDRLVYEMTEFGRSSGTYSTQEISVALNRSKLASAFFYTLPGPKMLWQFQELGYDIDINFAGRTGEKPLPWGAEGLGYYEDEQRQKLYNTTSEIINLTNTYADAFDEGSLTTTLSGDLRTISIEHEELNVEILGNFSLTEQSRTATFSKSGTWYNFFTGDTLVLSGSSTDLTFAPGQFYLFTDQPVFSATANLVDVFRNIVAPDPAEFNSLQEVNFTLDAAAADPDETQGLIDAESIFLYAGVVLEPGSNEVSNFVGSLDGTDLGLQLTPLVGEENKWAFSLTARDYFGIATGERIYKIAMKFRDELGDNLGTNTGGDFIYFDVLPDEELSIVTVSPAQFGSTDNITITYDAEASEPAGALVGASKVYMHSGVITVENGTSWELVVGNWGQDDGIGQMTKVPGESNKWEISITPRNYYQVPEGTSVYRLGMVFRNADGSKEGKAEGLQDIYVDVPIIDDGVPTGIVDELISNFSTYPNPTFDLFNVRLTGVNTISVALLTDLSGKKIREWRNLIAEGGEFRFDLSDLESGVYALTFTSGLTQYGTRVIKR